jgi:nucleoside-diphosphate-sugar epimerase
MEFVVALMAASSMRPSAVILIGSTGVYPRGIGGVWSEERPIPVETPRQEVLLSTEQALVRGGLPYVILRCGGLYGEGRDNRLWVGRKTELLSTELTDEPLAFVHQDDVCDVIDRVISRGVVREIFNVRDDSAFSRRELYTALAARAGVPIVDRGPAPLMVDRRIPNEKLKARLGYQFCREPITAYLAA